MVSVSVHGVDKFVSFVQSLHTLYSMSPKNLLELKNISVELGEQIAKIGKIFDVRWVASSLRTVSAIWKSYASLYHHFYNMSKNESMTSANRAKLSGLARKLQSPQFLLNIALMNDVLNEISPLSLLLQNQQSSLASADHYVKKTIRVLESLKNEPGDFVSEARNL
jgi:hypothetical protein